MSKVKEILEKLPSELREATLKFGGSLARMTVDQFKQLVGKYKDGDKLGAFEVLRKNMTNEEIGLSFQLAADRLWQLNTETADNRDVREMMIDEAVDYLELAGRAYLLSLL